MTRFNNGNFNIEEDVYSDEEIRVVKSGETAEPVVQPFVFSDIKSNHDIQPEKPLVRHFDAPPMDGSRENRFVLSQLAKRAFSIGREEEELIEKRVAEGIEALAQKTREDAFKQGYDDGVKDGHDAAFKEAQAENVKRLAQIDALVKSMDQAKVEVFEANRQFLVNVIYRIAKTIILKELSSDKEYLLRLCKELIEKTGLRENLIIKIHPSDAKGVDALRSGLVKELGTLPNLSVVLTDQVELGGCILETEWGATDASLQTQLSQIMKGLDVPEGTKP